MAYLSLAVGELDTNCYLVYDEAGRQCLVVDPGDEAERIAARIEAEHLLPQAVVLTHGHPDHLGAAAALMARYRIPLWLHAADEAGMRSEPGRGLAAIFGVGPLPAAGRLLADGDRVAAGDLELAVIHSPGHSPGSILLFGGGLLFSGDTLFQGDVGRTDLPGGSEEELRRSLERIRLLPPATRVLPGHGPESLLERELSENPYL
ncbi:MAG TPA: MBL fold metallo-hydrolase [Candidatus Aminicenantes bacterium]|nr:MBL fold metallo-hydrolase [Candidatus Aminicenantes bacterium]